MISFSFIFSLSAGDENTISLLNSLYSNSGWNILKKSDNILLSTKLIPGKNLSAVMVKKELNLPKEILQEVIMDIKRY